MGAGRPAVLDRHQKGANNTPLAVTRADVEALQAQAGKELVVFERSAHTPFMAEPELFNRALVRVKQETLSTSNVGAKGSSP